MRKDWLLIVVLVVLFVLVVGVLFLWEEVGVEPDSLGSDGSDSDLGSDSDDVSFGGSGSSSGSGSGVGYDSVVGSDVVDVNVSEAECGFYFEEYGVCGGTCPGSGTCVSEGRSCYCKDL